MFLEEVVMIIILLKHQMFFPKLIFLKCDEEGRMDEGQVSVVGICKVVRVPGLNCFFAGIGAGTQKVTL
jgi:hypothetical protein